ncbi:MAG TPA: HlyD family efflux transporter periplasmic adaptor subunit [Candidatus Sulfomarinibacteraceae bacterium]|nr:HlyD family efflux transporter periplasmic adaptor subunit [Candidatus Sulfomarinibacteraceae bacterium]
MPRHWTRWPLLFAGALLVSLGFLAACSSGGPRRSGAQVEGQVVEAFIGDLAASASASGKVLPRRSAMLAPQAAGRVQTVFVEAGDVVQVGEPLLQVEAAELEAAVASAEQDLAMQQAALDRLLAGPLPEEIAAAEATVASARAQLERLRQGPRPEEIAAAEANLRAAQAGVWAASEQYGQAQTGATEAEIARARSNLAAAQLELARAEQANEDNPVQATHQAMLDAREAVEIAQAELDSLLAGPNADSVGAAQADVGAAAAQRDARAADLELMRAGASAAQIAGAEASLAQAEASLESLLSGPTEEEVRTVRAQVQQAQLALEDAQDALGEVTLRAPFDGVVSAVHVSEGEIPGGPAIELLDAASLQVVLSVDEADVGSLAVGQPATVTLEAWPEEEIESEIVEIAPSASESPESALVSYEVSLSLEQAASLLSEEARPVRAGMTASAQLLTAQREDVLLLPSRAIIVDREAGRYYVDLLVPAEDGEGDTVQRVEVTIGLRDDQNTQILDGLQAGDRVRVSTRIPSALQGRGGGPFGE